MTRSSLTLFWRRLDLTGLERLTLVFADDQIVAEATTLGVEDGGFRLDHRWKLTSDWSVLSCVMHKDCSRGHVRLAIERYGIGWKVDGDYRPDLDGTAEPDLSVTPFCNTFPIHRLMANNQDDVTLETSFIDASKMKVSRSRQSYHRQGSQSFRYFDLGFADGFEADLSVDQMGLVTHYEGLFERVEIR